MNSPKVSIGMPVYNGARFICNALDSLLAQTFVDFELIISDNASTDRTSAICQDYAEKDFRIHYIRQPENRGAIANFKFLLEEAVGEYFMWAAADDTWSPDFMMTCLHLLAKNNQAAMAMTGYDVPSYVGWINLILYRQIPNHPLSCIQKTTNTDRLKAYTKMSYIKSHKDNLVYALWKREIIKFILDELAFIFNGVPLIGGAMNEYALALYQGAYSPEVLFHKRYKFPPGSKRAELIRYLRDNIFKRSEEKKNLKLEQKNLRLEQIQKVLKYLEFDPSFISELTTTHNRD